MSLCTTRKRPHPGANDDHAGSPPDTIETLASQKLAKRRRASPPPQDPPSPPQPIPSKNATSPNSSLELLAQSQKILAVEASALAAVATLYATSALAQENLLRAVEAILTAQSRRGKLIVTGVGKSGYIAQKLVATCKSLGIAASWLHAGEAVHGDLGDVREDDVLLLLTHSGTTPELLSLLPHIPLSTPLIALTSHRHAPTCPLFASRHPSLCVLLPAPIPEPEEATFGVAAPTTSTTVALAVADMLALTVAGEVHREGKGVGVVFRGNHPGGAIGKVTREGGEVEGGAGLLSPEASGSDDW